MKPERSDADHARTGKAYGGVMADILEVQVGLAPCRVSQDTNSRSSTHPSYQLVSCREVKAHRIRSTSCSSVPGPLGGGRGTATHGAEEVEVPLTWGAASSPGISREVSPRLFA